VFEEEGSPRVNIDVGSVFVKIVELLSVVGVQLGT